jgi:3-methyladenine DNA glycosylase AlkD
MRGLEEVADGLERRLREVGERERAEQEKRYLKSDLVHLGASVPQVRGEVKAFIKAHRDISTDEVVALVEALWSKPVHERRMAAALLLESRAGVLGPDALPLLERLIRESRTWALIDVLAGDVAGLILVAHPDAAPRLDRWATDPDFWVRRAALLAMIEPLRRGAPFDRFGGYADTMLEETEFFIRKAIGWVLRETGKRRPDEVLAWLGARAHRASGVTMREAVKYLAPAQRDSLLQAHARTPAAGKGKGRR